MAAASPSRLLAFGDIHGYSVALDALLQVVAPRAEENLVFLGDYVHRGPDTRGVLERLLGLRREFDTVCLLGNHDELLMRARRDLFTIPAWLAKAGDSPLGGYANPSGGSGTTGSGPQTLNSVPDSHWRFLEEDCQDYHETEAFIFVHAGVSPGLDLAEDSRETLFTRPLEAARPHHSGRTVICGHTSQKSGLIADLGHTVCIDTGISKGGWLTCLDVLSWSFWQASQDGLVRSGQLR